MGLFKLFRGKEKPEETKSKEANRDSLSKGQWAISDKKFTEAEKEFMTVISQKSNKIDVHLAYNGLIKLYFKQRDAVPEALDKCIEYCRKDIELFPEFKKAWNKKYGQDDLPNSIPSFDKLWRISIGTRDLETASEVCQKAINYNWCPEEWKDNNSRIENFKVIIDFIKNNPSVLQKDLYRLLPEIPREDTKYLMRALADFGGVKREKHSSTYKLYIEN